MKGIFFSLLLFVFASPVITAQDNSCAALRDEALATALQSCAGVGPNEICLGHMDVASMMSCETAMAFESPGDIIPINAVCAMRLGAMQPAGTWGVAVMRPVIGEANDTLTYVLLGDVEIQNTGSAASQIRVWANADTDIRSGPGSSYESLVTVAAGTVLNVNACNCTQNWLRTVLEDGRVGWILTRSVTVFESVEALPVVKGDTPIYGAMQAFNFSSGQAQTPCAEAALSGILMQAPTAGTDAQAQINGVQVVFTSTLFTQAQPGGSLTIRVLDGSARVTADNFTALVSAGAEVVIPLADTNVPEGLMRVQPLHEADVADLPLALLPRAISPLEFLNDPVPQIVGLETCSVISNRGAATCPLHFINPDGDPITRMDIIFDEAPQGEWSGSVDEAPELIGGDLFGGQLAWKPTCSLGGANFIGPVKWVITLIDSTGHVSPPFEATFNCVDG
ncbi:MAG: SH3 domain-containing protein [Anaerolineae bacterium]|nr:SH3 domain-containing protein [Anaerolineae bacterium]